MNINETLLQNKWKKFFSYYKPYMGLFLADMFFAFLAASVTLILPILVRYITGTVIYKEPSESMDMIWKLTIVMVLLIVISTFSNFFITYYGHMMGAKMEFNMRKEIFAHYQKLSFTFYDNEKVGQLMSRITNDLFDISELFHHGPEDIIISIIKFVGSFTILMFINVKLALVACAIIPVMFVYAFVLNKKMKKAFKRNRVKLAEINSRIEDNLSGIRVVKSFANEEIEEEKFDVGNQGFLSSKRNSYQYMGTYHSGLAAFTNLITVIVIAAGSMFITKGMVSIADLLTFMLYINNFIEPVNKLINFTEQFQNGITGYERFLEILSICPDITDDEAEYEPDTLKGNIEFENVSFKYEDSLEDVLKNVNLKVQEGEYIALVGFSGAGKTTLCSLIPRFYEVTSGCIRIDGMDIRNIRLKNLRNNIGIVQQEVYLFAGTVYENILYGKPDATREEVIEAAKSANAHEFIMGLPNGYDTDIGQRGVKLSGGQKQRLSIARVFLKNPPILIFDEATSALDNESEKVVQESLETLAKNR
ncbi:MAG: ABC transporter ATP-binding protein, partial [Lachnospiraceae bacterium]|nr:ABC transporter ATP-binding protein [Lachnospiraceae bacterium]